MITGGQTGLNQFTKSKVQYEWSTKTKYFPLSLVSPLFMILLTFSLKMYDSWGKSSKKCMNWRNPSKIHIRHQIGQRSLSTYLTKKRKRRRRYLSTSIDVKLNIPSSKIHIRHAKQRRKLLSRTSQRRVALEKEIPQHLQFQESHTKFPKTINTCHMRIVGYAAALPLILHKARSLHMSAICIQ